MLVDGRLLFVLLAHILAIFGDLEFSDELVNAEAEELRWAIHGINVLAWVPFVVNKLQFISIGCVHWQFKRTWASAL